MQSLITFDDVLAEAYHRFISIPPTISEGINSGAYMPAESVQELEDLIEYDDMIQQASDAGVSVPQSVSDGIKSGELKPADAVQQMENLIEFNDLLKDSSAAGQKVPQIFQQAVLNGKMSPAQAVKEMTDLMSEEAEKGAKKTGKAGTTAGSEMTKNLENKKNSVKTAGSKAAEEGAKGADSKQEDFKTAGKNMGEGIKKGVESKEESLFDKMRNLASNMWTNFCNFLGIHSPSKKFAESARWIPEGIAKGIEDNEDVVNGSISNITQSMMDESYELREAGRRFGESYVSGIDEMTDEAERSAEQMSTRTIEALEKAQMKNIFDAYTPEQLDKAFDKLRSASNNITNRIVESAMVPSSKNLKLSRKHSSASIFPRQIVLIGGGKQTGILQLQNGQEIAHWLAPDISKELGIMR